MSELEEFIFLLKRHPEMIPALLQLARGEASRDEFQQKQDETTE